MLHLEFRIPILLQRKNKADNIDVDDILDGLSIAAITLELHAEDRAADTPKIEFSVNKVLAERFSNNPLSQARMTPRL